MPDLYCAKGNKVIVLIPCNVQEGKLLGGNNEQFAKKQENVPAQPQKQQRRKETAWLNTISAGLCTWAADLQKPGEPGFSVEEVGAQQRLVLNTPGESAHAALAALSLANLCAQQQSVLSQAGNAKFMFTPEATALLLGGKALGFNLEGKPDIQWKAQPVQQQSSEASAAAEGALTLKSMQRQSSVSSQREP